MVAPWVKKMTEEVIGGSPVEIGKFYTHPEDGLIEITHGQYWGEHGLSNHWTWRVIETDEMHHGYAGNWPEAPRCTSTAKASAGKHAMTLQCSKPLGHKWMHYAKDDNGVSVLKWANDDTE